MTTPEQIAGLTEAERYRLVQDGIPVAWADGSNAFREINHYAAVYSQDGPVKIQKRVCGKWCDNWGKANDRS